MTRTKKTALACTALALAAGAFGFTRTISAQDAIEDLRKQCSQLSAERTSLDTDREALWGQTTDGAAWPHYQAAMHIARAMQTGNEWAAAECSPAADPVERARFVEAAEPLYTCLERAAHARDVTDAINWHKGMSASIQRLTEARFIPRLAVARAWHELDRGDDMGAVQSILDAQQFGRDLCTSPILIEEMIGCALLMADPLQDFTRDGGAARLSREAKMAWFAGLDQLLAELPRGSQGLRGELELFGTHVLNGSARDAAAPVMFSLPSQAWHGSEFADAASEYIGVGIDMLTRVEDAYNLPGPAALAALDKIEAEYKSAVDPAFEGGVVQLRSAATSRFRAMSLLAFQRHALALDLNLALGPGLDLDTELPEDFFGDGVQVEMTDAHVRVWTERDDDTIEIHVTR